MFSKECMHASSILALIVILVSAGIPRAFAKDEIPGRAAVGQCNPIPEELAGEIQPGRVILFGEIHGTWETPAAFSDVVCFVKNEKMPAKIGFELERKFADDLQRFVSATDEERSLRDLRELSFWHTKWQDGKRSEAMLELLKTIRRWNLENEAELSVFAFDSKGDERESDMAQNMLDESDPDRVLLVLTVNYHSRTTYAKEEDIDRKWMGHYLEEAGTDTVSINALIRGGSAWLCLGRSTEDCGIQESEVPDYLERKFVEGGEENYHDYVWWLGSGTASRPAFAESD